MQTVVVNGRSKMYDANVLMSLSIQRTPDLRTNTQYIEAKERYIDETMSCNPAEAKKWMTYYMSKAIAWGVENEDRNWQYSFAAAYDILESICKHYK